MELDRTRAEEGTNRRLRCCSGMDTRREKKKRPPKNNLATNGGRGTKRCRLELLDSGTPRSLRPAQMEERCPSLMRLLALRDLRLRSRINAFPQVHILRLK